MVEQELDRALKLEPSGAGVWSAVADPKYESANGMLGGWTTAVALRAVTNSATVEAEPSVINVNFVAKIEPTSKLIIQTRQVGGSRTVSHWMAELMSENAQATLATASLPCAVSQRALRSD